MECGRFPHASAFKTPPPDLVLRDDEIHIWHAELDQPRWFNHMLTDTLSNAEKERAERLHFEHHRRRFTVSRGLLRALLAHYSGMEPHDLAFNYGPNGKPFMADCLDTARIRFNLSHSEGYALFAFTRDREVGVDIEYVQAFSEMEEIAGRFFSPQENLILQTLSRSEKKRAFYLFWTRREALAKAIGMGLSLALDQMDVSRCPGQLYLSEKCHPLLNTKSHWFIQDIKPVPGFAAAFATEGRDWRLHCWRWSHELNEFNGKIPSATASALN
jgi:4'-phosphopantetheinyl transferase